MYEYKIDCEVAMNKLLAHLKYQDILPFDRLNIAEAFQSLGKDDNVYLEHYHAAKKYNSFKTVDEMLDYACACDMLVEYKNSYIAIDWTDNEMEIANKVNKHKWLRPIYAQLGISCTLVIKARGYLNIKTRTDEMVARLNASRDVLSKIDGMLNKEITNDSLVITIKTTL